MPGDLRVGQTPWSVFQDGSDGVPARSPLTRAPPGSRPVLQQRAVGTHCEQSIPVEVPRRGRRPGPLGLVPVKLPRPHARPSHPACNALPHEGEGSPCRELRRTQSRSRRSPRRKCTRQCPPLPRPPVPTRGSTVVERGDAGQVESLGSTVRSRPFASGRFHVLLNSLFKVLFNFPSRYLSAIGLAPVFSLGWSLPPTLGCIPKQPDSGGPAGDARRDRRGLTPAVGRRPDQEDSGPGLHLTQGPKHHNSHRPWPGDSALCSSRFTRRY